MGQYFFPVNFSKKQWVYSHDYFNGLKLMEHSWIENIFVTVVESLIQVGGDWHGDRIVWAGDYADNEKRRKNNLYGIIGIDKNKIKPNAVKRNPDLIYLVNLDKKEFVDMTKVPVSDVYEGSEFRIHPLPLLTCEGNGRGGGDYRGESPLIGKWARDRVVIQMDRPTDCDEIVFDLKE